MKDFKCREVLARAEPLEELLDAMAMDGYALYQIDKTNVVLADESKVGEATDIFIVTFHKEMDLEEAAKRYKESLDKRKKEKKSKSWFQK